MQRIHMLLFLFCFVFIPTDGSNHLFSCFDIYRYDYLEFTDSRGGKVRYDMKVGTEKWPKVGDEKPDLPPFETLSLNYIYTFAQLVIC